MLTSGGSGEEQGEGTLEFLRTVLRGVEVMNVQNVSRQWAFFHETFSFCAATRVADPSGVPWRYRGRTHWMNREGVQLMEPGEFHSNLWVAPSADFRVLFVHHEELTRLSRELGWNHAERPHLRLAQLHGGPLLPLVRKLTRLLPETNCPERAESGLTALVKGLVRLTVFDAEFPKAPVRASRRAALLARDLIHAEWNHPLPMSRVAAQANVPMSTLERTFKAVFGTTPRQYQLHMRLMRAKEAIKGGGVPIAAVAAECGFQDPRYFSRLFGREFGCAPSEYQLQMSTEPLRERKKYAGV